MSDQGATASDIQRFYRGKAVLLTGGTGFLGKVLVEKLLRSCPDIGTVYLLVRDKKGVPAGERMAGLLADSVFLRLKKEQPQSLEKLVLMGGDLVEEDLGLSEADRSQLIERVEVVIHSAATTKFNATLRVAINTNVRATQIMCRLASRISNLKAFVHVSTAFCNCEKDFIPERVIPQSLSADQLLGLADLLDESTLHQLTPILIHLKQNTYLLSKSAAEEIVLKCSESLPVAILRPSGVSCTDAEPTPGWVDNYQTSTCIVAGVCTGVSRVIPCDVRCQMNIIPVDRVINTAIVLAYATASQQFRTKFANNLPVVNCVAKSYNCLTFGDFLDYVRKYAYQYPSLKLPWYPFITTPRDPWAVKLHSLLLEELPALIIDWVTSWTDRPTNMKNIVKALRKYKDAIAHFTHHQFNFEEENVDVLWGLLGARDRELFPFSMSEFTWTDFMKAYVMGFRQHMLAEDPASLDTARTRVKKLYVLHMASVGTGLFLVLWLSYCVTYTLGELF